MPIPRFPEKHEHGSLITPQQFLAYVRSRSDEEYGEAPESVLLLFQRSLFLHVAETRAVERVHFVGDLHVLRDAAAPIGVAAGFGIGAPALATTVEELIALGARRFISVGSAGTLQPTLSIGGLVVCSEAIRDEGVSHHYLRPDAEARPSVALTAALKGALDARSIAYREGPTWTIDAPYRETAAEARHYRDDGVLTVDMEAAALFAVAAYRGVDAAAAFAVSDSLAELTWDPHFGSDATREGLATLFAAAVEALGG